MIMPDNSKFVVSWYYCNNCKKDVKADLNSYIEGVINETKCVKVIVVATCRECDSRLEEDEDWLSL